MDRQSPAADQFFSICRKGSFTDLEKWLQSHHNFVINQPEGLTGNTGLHKAALSELHSKAKTELLLNQGANLSVRNDFMETPAHRYLLTIVWTLIQIVFRKLCVDFSAAKSGNLETLKLLVENGGLSGILMGYNCKAEAAKQKTSRRHSSRFVQIFKAFF